MNSKMKKQNTLKTELNALEKSLKISWLKTTTIKLDIDVKL